MSQRITLPRSCGNDDAQNGLTSAACRLVVKVSHLEFAFAALKGNMSGVHNSVLNSDLRGAEWGGERQEELSQ